jgi:ubiquitin conjugation factor E4 B
MTSAYGWMCPGCQTPDIELKTTLGSLFQISPLQKAVTASYFSSPKTLQKNTIADAQRALRMALKTHQSDLLDITNHIIRSSKDSRLKVLDWFAMVVNANQKRRGIQVDPKTVSTDGFMINITTILDQLCEPFMDSTFSKIDRIDPDYLRRPHQRAEPDPPGVGYGPGGPPISGGMPIPGQPRVSIKDETKLNADQETADNFYSQKVGGESNFISEVFFLTMAAHHYGSEATITKLTQLDKDLKSLEKHIAMLEADRVKWINSPQLALYDAKLKEFKDKVESGMSYKMAVTGVLHDDITQARSMLFMRYVIQWLLRIVSPSQSYPKNKLVYVVT